SLYNKGKDAEAKQNYEQAYEYYKQAYDQKPQDLGIRASFERLRFLAGASHVHRGQLLRDAGKLQEALAEFQKAAEIDASSFIAQQEVRRTQKMIDAAAQQTPGPRSATPAEVLDKRLENAKGPVELAPIANIPITLKVTDDSKRIYETVGKLAGINVLFDPDYTSRRIPVELNGVTLEEAMGVIALESKTFWRPVTPNTIFVAQDNPAKRRELEQNVLKTFYLANVSQNTEIQEVVNTLRSILEIQKVQPLPSQGAIVIRGTPDQVLLAEKLINDLDRSKPEVVVEVAVMQISKDKKHNLGINPGTSASISLQNNVNTTSGSGTNDNNNNSNNNSSSNGINLNRLGNLNATDFVVGLPSATVTALYSDNNTKILQNPSVRSVDGQKASLKIGDRVPVATGSFQPGIGGVGINPLVNTQFQYLDVGVNIDITPRIHAGGEVTLKIAMDISSVTGNSNIGGISQPIIGQRKIEHEIRLKDGEPSLMGGMFEDDDIRSVSGIPGLSQIPLLKYLFSETDIEHRKNEIVFVLIPHIVRGPEYSDLNQSALEIGTGTAIDIRRASNAPPAQPSVAQTQPRQQSVAQPASQPMAPAQQPSMQPQQPAVQPAAQTMPAASAQGSAVFGFDPPNIVQPTGSTFAVNVMINGAQNVYSVPLQVSYDPKVLQVVNVSNGGILSQDGQAVTLLHREDESTGTMQITATRPPGAAGVSGGGAVVTLTFLAKGAGQSMLTISKGGARDPSMQAMPVAGAVGTVTVQ
ncbi:MAG TPA: cohesin domain-containing protein, partial [Terriglobales bacterium]|nr:cohesin domain-containing protein [Terriglobales bacterium]